MTNIGDIFIEVYQVVEDRKKNPKSGAYTSYLLEKGQDKICKKVVEEATELVLAAKNQDKEQAVRELADLYYHLMVLMVQENITWEEIAAEMKNRRT